MTKIGGTIRRYPSYLLKEISLTTVATQKQCFIIQNRNFSHQIPEEKLKYERLFKVYRSFTDTSHSVKYSVIKCLEEYDNSETVFMEDVLKYPKVNKDILNYMTRHYWHSSSIRSLVYHDLYELWKQEKYDVVNEIVETINEDCFHSQAFKNYPITQDLKDRNEVLNRIIILASLSGDVLIGSSFAISATNEGCVMFEKTLGLIFYKMAEYRGSLIYHYHYALLKLVNKFHDYPFSPKELQNIFDSLLHQQGYLHFANIMMDRFHHVIINTSNREISHIIDTLISNNIDYHQTERGYKLWGKYYPHCQTLKSTTKLLKEVNLDQGQQIISQLKQPKGETLEAIIRFYGTKKHCTEEFQKYLKLLPTPIERSVLSILLESFVAQGSTIEVEKILKIILKQKNGLTSQDLNFIIIKLLYEGKIDTAIEMVSSIDSHRSKMGLISVFKYVLMKSSDEEKSRYIKMMINKLETIPNDPIQEELLPCIIHYLSSKYSNHLSRSLIISIDKERDIKNSFKHIRIGVDNIFNDLMIFVICPIHIRVKCLYSILEFAILDQDLDTLRWSIQELRVCGILVQDIVNHCKNKDSALYNKVFNQLQYI